MVLGNVMSLGQGLNVFVGWTMLGTRDQCLRAS